MSATDVVTLAKQYCEADVAAVMDRGASGERRGDCVVGEDALGIVGAPEERQRCRRRSGGEIWKQNTRGGCAAPLEGIIPEAATEWTNMRN